MRCFILYLYLFLFLFLFLLLSFPKSEAQNTPVLCTVAVPPLSQMKSELLHICDAENVSDELRYASEQSAYSIKSGKKIHFPPCKNQITVYNIKQGGIIFL